MSRNRKIEISKDVMVLRYMRINAGLSLEGAGKELKVSGSAISHIENGKMQLPVERVEKMVGLYGYTMADFFKLCRQKTLPVDLKTECQKLLKTVPSKKLTEVRSYLKSLQINR